MPVEGEIYKEFTVARNAARAPIPPRPVAAGQTEVDLQSKEGMPRTEKVSQLLALGMPRWGEAVEAAYDQRNTPRFRTAEAAQAMAARVYFDWRIDQFAQRMLPGRQERWERRGNEVVRVAFETGRVQAGEIAEGTTEAQLEEAENQLSAFLYGVPGAGAGAPRVFGPRPAPGSLGGMFLDKFMTGFREFDRRGWAGGGANQMSDGSTRDLLFGITRENIRVLRRRVAGGDIGRALNWEQDGPLAVHGAGIPERAAPVAPTEEEEAAGQLEREVRAHRLVVIASLEGMGIPEEFQRGFQTEHGRAISRLRALNTPESNRQADVFEAEVHLMQVIEAQLKGEADGDTKEAVHQKGTIFNTEDVKALTMVEGGVERFWSADRTLMRLISKTAGGYLKVRDVLPGAEAFFGEKTFWDLSAKAETKELRRRLIQVVAGAAADAETVTSAREAVGLAVLFGKHRKRFEIEAPDNVSVCGMNADGKPIETHPMENPWVNGEAYAMIHPNAAIVWQRSKSKPYGPAEINAVVDRYIAQRRSADPPVSFWPPPDIFPSVMTGDIRRFDYFAAFKSGPRGSVRDLRGVSDGQYDVGEVDSTQFDKDLGMGQIVWGAVRTINGWHRGIKGEKEVAITEVLSRLGWYEGFKQRVERQFHLAAVKEPKNPDERGITAGERADRMAALAQAERIKALALAVELGIDQVRSTPDHLVVRDLMGVAQTAAALEKLPFGIATFLKDAAEVFDSTHYPPRLDVTSRDNIDMVLGIVGLGPEAQALGGARSDAGGFVRYALGTEPGIGQRRPYWASRGAK